MVKHIYLKILMAVSLLIFFIKIYQGNRFVRKNYEKQRLNQAVQALSKKHEALSTRLLALRHYGVISKWASEECAMKRLTLSQTILIPGSESSNNDDKKL